MRLLRLEDDGEFSLVEIVGKNIPHYAILSHTWGADDEEVTFKDAVDGAGKSKAGYGKIRFCGKQAANDGLQYFWVDTCCIDKSSSAELSEAINSMFRWYHEAAKCYVYLSDVSTDEFASNVLSFQKSRWFTRGWTLQELIAPTSVEFFSSEGDRLGDKNALVQEIAAITGISIRVLQGCPLHQFSVNERMSWAERRETKREEDTAYSLLGIFDIHMPLLYGEGRNKALIRLQKEITESLRDKWPTLSLVSSTEAAEVAGEFHKSRIPFNDIGAVVHERQVADAEQRILNSLRFPQIQERKHQIHEAHKETCQWILQPVSNRSQQWDSLIAWLSSPAESRRIYWIYGKPGSGKSTMMRFLDQNVTIPDHMLPWAENRTVLNAQYFFWNPGHKLQKSITGLLRTLLLQLLEKQPHLIPHVVHQRKWTAARTPGNDPIDWTNSDLQHVLHEFILSVRSYAKVFLLLDGLDELDDSNDACEELISLLINTASLENVKVCISSRPWNIFRDAFGEFPQLRLEDLTQGDINKYVEGQLHSHIRFQYLFRHDRMNAENLVSEITHKAAGVFLWVRLVVRELLKGLRDGDGISVLRKRLREIPGDLNDYFKRLMDSIDPNHRQEASALLQIALYDEREFATGHPLRLIDLSFIDEGRPDFALTGRYSYKDLDLTNWEALQFRLDSALRRLNSRCMGLLECQYQPEWLVGDVPYPAASQLTEEVEQDAQVANIRSGQIFEPSIYPQIFRGPIPLSAFTITIRFLHRSCRDFLLTSEVQSLLHKYTHGPYDSRMFLLCSRLSQFVAFETARAGERQAITIASYLLSTLSRPTYKCTPICAVVAATIQPILEKFVQNYDDLNFGWYIEPSINSWYDEQSTFVTLAIDFDLVSYVRTHITSGSVRGKRGRPILDYILRPRFLRTISPMSIGNQRPNLELLGVVLHLGADPNEMYESVTVWSLFLCLLADSFAESTYDTYFQYSGALEMLIRAGAAPLLPKSWLSHETYYVYYAPFFEFETYESPETRFSRRWPAAVPAMEWNPGLGSEPWYAVSHLLECFRSYLGSDVDKLRTLLDTRPSRISWQPGG